MATATGKQPNSLIKICWKLAMNTGNVTLLPQLMAVALDQSCPLETCPEYSPVVIMSCHPPSQTLLYKSLCAKARPMFLCRALHQSTIHGAGDHPLQFCACCPTSQE